jgi:hypothetical protein
MKRQFAAMEASARSVIELARNHEAGEPYRRELNNFAESGGLCAYTEDNRPLYRCRTGRRTTDVLVAIESYAEAM